MAGPTLAELLSEATIDAVFSKMLAVLQAGGFPVTDWNASGGSERTRIKAFATALKDLAGDLIPLIAAGGFIELAKGAWLKLLARNRYATDFVEASFTVGTIKLSCVPTAGPHTLTVGTHLFKFPTGNRYRLTGLPNGSTVPSNGSLDVTVTSESPNDSANGRDYIDSSNAAITMVTPLTGVTATNPAPPYGPVTQIGTGTGTVTPTAAPLPAPQPAPNHYVVIRIDTTGQAGVATWSYQIDGGSFVSKGAAVSDSDLAGLGMIVTLANGSTNPSFIAGDTYSFQTPGTWIITQGRDEEGDDALAARCKNRWPSLNFLLDENGVAVFSSPTLALYDYLVRKASSQVTMALIETDPVINNRVNIIIAGQGGVLPGGVITTVQDFFKKRVPITDRPVVMSPTPVDVTYGGVVTCQRALFATALPLVEAALRTYTNRLVGINGVVRLAEVVDIFMSTDGIVDITGLTINGFGANLVLPSVPGYQLPRWNPAQSAATAFTWNLT